MPGSDCTISERGTLRPCCLRRKAVTRGCTARILEKFCRRPLNWLCARWAQGREGTSSSLQGDSATHSSMQDTNATRRHCRGGKQTKPRVRKYFCNSFCSWKSWQNSLKDENHFPTKTALSVSIYTGGAFLSNPSSHSVSSDLCWGSPAAGLSQRGIFPKAGLIQKDTLTGITPFSPPKGLPVPAADTDLQLLLGGHTDGQGNEVCDVALEEHLPFFLRQGRDEFAQGSFLEVFHKLLSVAWKRRMQRKAGCWEEAGFDTASILETLTPH